MECPAAEKGIGHFLDFFFRRISRRLPWQSLAWNFICVAGICIYIIFRWQYQITLLFNSYYMLRLDSRLVRSDWIFFCSSGTNSEGSSGGCAATSQGPQTITQPARHFLVSSWRKTGWWKKATHASHLKRTCFLQRCGHFFVFFCVQIVALVLTHIHLVMLLKVKQLWSTCPWQIFEFTPWQKRRKHMTLGVPLTQIFPPRNTSDQHKNTVNWTKQIQQIHQLRWR